MAPTLQSAAEAVAILLHRGTPHGHSSRLAAEAKTGLRAVVANDTATAATFLFRDKERIASQLILLYILYRLAIPLQKTDLKNLWWHRHPFFQLPGASGTFFRLADAFRGAYLHFPLKTVTKDKLTWCCVHILKAVENWAQPMECIGFLILVLYLRSVQFGTWAVQHLQTWETSLAQLPVEYWRATSDGRRAFLPTRFANVRKTGNKRRQVSGKRRIQANTDVNAATLSSVLSFVGQFLDNSLDHFVTTVSGKILVDIELCEAILMPGSSKTERKSRLMVNHILLTFAALKLIQRDKTEIATVATKNQGTAAKKYVTWSGMDLAQLHAEVQTDFDNLDVSKLSLHNQRLIAKVQRQWTLSHTSIASCKTWHILRCFADLDRTNWVADKDPSLRKCFQKISLRGPPKCKRRCEQPKKKKQKK